MRLKPVVVLVVAAASVLGACGDDGDDDGGGAGGEACPVPASTVAGVLDATIEVGDGGTAAQCTYSVVVEETEDDEEPGRAGARVVVDVRAIAEGDYAIALERVERRTGPTDPLPADAVDAATRGWVGTVGRAVSVGAADDTRLATVVVLDPTLDAVAARDAALEIAGEALR